MDVSNPPGLQFIKRDLHFIYPSLALSVCLTASCVYFALEMLYLTWGEIVPSVYYPYP